MSGDPPAHHALLILRSLAEIVIVALFVITFIATPARIPSESMLPTLHPGDLLLADTQSFAPEGRFARILPPTAVHRGDIAIFHFPRSPQTTLVKRIIGLPGDRIRLHDGHVLLNDAPLPEPYAFHSPAAAEPFRDNFPTLHSLDPQVDPAWWATLRQSAHNSTITVPPSSYFVLGDNRNSSEDSRYWGFVPADHLIARPLLIYIPQLHLLH